MKIEQIYTGCLAHAAYYIESKGEVAIFDPLREVHPYIERAEKDQAKIKYIFETHFHADFVSGHLDLAKKTGAKIIFGPTAKPNYEAIIAKDGQVFKVGDYTLKLLHTPGHTMESIVVLLIDENGKEHGIISGDTLFIGDVGRPDLAQHVVADLTEKKLAGYLFDSLRNKIMPLSDDLIVYPNHGAGSACGKKMSDETTDTLGHQKKTNYALRADMTKEEFIIEVLDGLSTPPAYFPANVLMNINGYNPLDTVIKTSKKPLSVANFETIANTTEALILDVRHKEDFVKGHIPNAIFIGIDSSSFAPWVGALIGDVQQSILLVADIGREEEVITRLARIGFDNVTGYLKGGFNTWKEASKEIAIINSITAKKITKILKKEKPPIFDVRKENEFLKAHLLNAKHTCLSSINNHLKNFPKDKIFYIHCASGYRSVITASILKSRGIHNFIDIVGGFNALKKESITLG